MAKIPIGLGQAGRLCGISRSKRFDILAEGLPIILQSAQGFWDGASNLRDNPREAAVLEGFAKEEAAKILILMDIVRCPQKIIDSKIGKLIIRFYDHLTRVLYVDAQSWKPTDLSELRGYIDQERKSHYIAGNFGEYILPNLNIYFRESQLYADIQASHDGQISWNSPTANPSLSSSKPSILAFCEALSKIGVLSRKGLETTSEIWGQLEFKNSETKRDSDDLMKQLLARTIEENLASETATEEDLAFVYRGWQMPMYNIDFKIDFVPLEELQKQQENILWAESGYSHRDY